MKKDHILKELISIGSEIFKLSDNQLKPDSVVGSIEQWDSLGHLQLFMTIQEKFIVQFTTEEIIDLSSIEQIADAIKEKTRK